MTAMFSTFLLSPEKSRFELESSDYMGSPALSFSTTSARVKEEINLEGMPRNETFPDLMPEAPRLPLHGPALSLLTS